MALAGIETLGSTAPDNLIASGADLHIGNVTLSAGQTLKRGTVLGKNKTSGECKTITNGASDGTEKVYAILTDDVVTGGETAVAEVYLSGSFHIDALTVGAGVDVKKLVDEARALNIYLVPSIAAK